MARRAHQNAATVLVRPQSLVDLELALMTRDLWVWPIATAPIDRAGARLAAQIRRALIERRGGAWDLAAAWTPVWVGFGPTWHQGEEPLPWSAHQALWATLAAHAGNVRHTRRLGGIPLFAPSAPPLR